MANDSGGVHDIFSLLDLVQIVPDALPHEYVIVCVKLLSCLDTLSFRTVPKVPFGAESVLFLGIVLNTFDVEAVTVPLLTPVVYDAETANVFVPFAEWSTVTVLVQMV